MKQIKLQELKEFREKYTSVRKMAFACNLPPITIQLIEKGQVAGWKYYLIYAKVLSELAGENLQFDFTSLE